MFNEGMRGEGILLCIFMYVITSYSYHRVQVTPGVTLLLFSSSGISTLALFLKTQNRCTGPG